MNNKKIAFLLPVSLLSVLIVSSASYAAESVKNTLYTALNGISLDLSQVTGDSPDTVMAKVLVWLVAFTAIYYVARFLLFKEDEQKKIALVLAAVVSLLGVVAMPAAFIKTIIETYSLFFIIGFLILPVVGLVLMRNKMLEILENHPFMFYGLGVVLFYFLNSVFQTLGTAIESGKFAILSVDYSPWIALASILCWVMLGWNFIMLMASAFSWGYPKSKEAVGAVKGALGKEEAEIKAVEKLGMAELKELKEAAAAVNAGEWNKAINLLNMSEQFNKRIQGLDNAVRGLNVQVSQNTSADARKFEKEITNLTKIIKSESLIFMKNVGNAINESKAKNKRGAIQGISWAASADKKLVQCAVAIDDIIDKLEKM